MSGARKKVVAVSQRVDYIAGRDEFRDALDQRLLLWLSSAGLIPVAVPNMLERGADGVSDNKSAINLDDWLNVIKPDAIVLSGGNNPGEYETRDSTEHRLVLWAREYRLPLLGICRGMQFMASCSGASLKPVTGHVGVRHRLNYINGHKPWVNDANSFHEYGLFYCPEDYEAIAVSEDGVIEAIRHLELPWEGWMWHPEREDPFRAADAKRFMEIIDSVKQKV